MSDLVDLELSDEERLEIREHLDTCSECAAVYHQLLRLKKLMHAKVRRPDASAGLTNLIRRGLADRSASRPSARTGQRTALAAALLLGLSIAGVVFVLLSRPPSRLAHAQMVRGCVTEFIRVTRMSGDDATPVSVAEAEFLESLRESTGMKIERLPLVDDAELLRGEPCELNGVRGVRLDYRLVADDDKIEYPLCVFVFDLECLECSDDLLKKLRKGENCECVQLDGNTVYCFRSSKHVYNVVTTLDPNRLKAKFRPRLPE